MHAIARGGNLVDPGSVYLFSRRGVVIVPKEGEVDEDAILDVVLDAGAGRSQSQ